jgi:drug/metabolite transporter (DMT)-like permease
MTDLSPTLDRPQVTNSTEPANHPSPPAEQGWATLMLVAVTLVWGLSFSWLKDWQIVAEGCPGGGLLSSLTLIGLRMTAAFVVVAICLPRLTFGATFREHLAGVAVGLVFYVGHVPQVWGLGTTTPALSALFTSLSSAWIPLVAWIYFGNRPNVWTILGFALAIVGTLVISGVGLGGVNLEGSGLKFGDWLTLLASVAFAGQVLILDRLGKNVRPGRLTAGFFAGPGILSLALAVLVAAAGPGVTAWWDWTTGTLSDPKAQWNIVRLTLLPTVLGFYWMNLYQPRVTASRAALVYLLEPVFASIYSVLFSGHDKLTNSLLIGGAMILAGNALAEAPNWLERRAAKP